MVVHAVGLARRSGAGQVVLETAETNARAQALYAQLGFERARGFVGYALRLGRA